MNKQQINNNNNTRVTVAGDPAGVTRGLVIKYYNKSIIFPPLSWLRRETLPLPRKCECHRKGITEKHS